MPDHYKVNTNFKETTTPESQAMAELSGGGE